MPGWKVAPWINLPQRATWKPHKDVSQRGKGYLGQEAKLGFLLETKIPQFHIPIYWYALPSGRAVQVVVLMSQIEMRTNSNQCSQGRHLQQYLTFINMQQEVATAKWYRQVTSNSSSKLLLLACLPVPPFQCAKPSSWCPRHRRYRTTVSAPVQV